nr:hypothetical protein [Tanacetum cinerariifolium]
YALTVKPTVYVSHLRQFWSTARIETTEERTKILATVDDVELFENLTLMGYNISPNQKFTFQKGQFSHQWKYLIYTIMQCLSSKSTGFNEFSSNISTALVCLATNRTYNFSKMIFDGSVKNVNNKVSKFLMYPRFLTMCLRMSQFRQITHTQMYAVPFHTKKLFTTLRMNIPSFSGRTVPLFADMLVHQGEGSGTPTKPHHTPSPKAQTPSHTTHPSSSLSSVTTTSIPTVTPTDTTLIRQYTRRTKIAQSSVPPTIADEPASPQRDSSTLPYDSALRVTSPAAVEGRDEYDEEDGATERVSDDTEEMATVLSSMDASIVLASRVVDVPTGSGSIPTASTLAEGSVPTGSEEVLTASLVFTTATVIDAQVARELEEKLEKEDQRRAEQIATVAKYLEEYHQFSSKLPMERRIELISDLVKYQENYAKIYKFQSQQIKSWTKKQKRDYYIVMIINNLSWKVKDFRGITFEEVEAKFNSVRKQMEDFIPIGSKEEAERIKRKGINLEQESAKKQKSSEEITEEAKSPEEVTEEKVKEMMHLVPIEEKTLSTIPPTSDKEMELWVELKWKLYDSCGVHHVVAKDKEICMLVEKDYPLRKGLALVMICYKLQAENFSHMENEFVLKIYRIANSPRQQGD